MRRSRVIALEREPDITERCTIVGNSPQLLEILATIHKIGPTDCSVVIVGETGTGKELIARKLHEQSGRKGEFVAINCAAIPKELAESILFGHKRGSFTGAVTDQNGLLALANQGTLFLDEISRLDLQIQSKLLSTLETKVFRAVGESHPMRSDFRILAAAQENLLSMVGTHNFLLDLYYRINTFSIDVPPLRERTEDIIPIAEYLLGELSKELNYLEPLTMHDNARTMLLGHSWPGNVRELRNVLLRALILGDGHIKAKNILFDQIDLMRLKSESNSEKIVSSIAQWFLDNKPMPLTEFVNLLEFKAVNRAMVLTEHNKKAAAEILGVNRPWLYERLRSYKKST